MKTADHQKSDVRNRARKCGGSEERARRYDVREVERGAERGTGDEAELNHRREPGGLRGIEIPHGAQLRRNSARRKPERHPEQLGSREKREQPPAMRMSVAMHYEKLFAARSFRVEGAGCT